MNIVLLGPQGSGKGTQAQLLAEKYGLTHISTGDLIREGVQKKDPVALKIKEQLDKGKLAPDKYVVKLVKQNLSKQNAIDGFPRTIQQAEALDEMIQIDLAIEIKIPDDESVKRLSARRQCKQCRAIFGTEAPPRKKDVCNRCGGELFQREDDKPEAIKKRLEIYHEETEPLLEYYNPRKIVHSVDGTKSIEDVFKQICDVIEKIVL